MSIINGTIRSLIDYATADVYRLEIIPMGCWMTLRGVCSAFAVAYMKIRRMFPEYVALRLREVLPLASVDALSGVRYTLVGDFMCDCAWGIRRPKHVPYVILVVAETVTIPPELCGHLWQSRGTASVLPCIVTPRVSGVLYSDSVGRYKGAQIDIKWVTTMSKQDYDTLIIGVVGSFDLACCRVAYRPDDDRLYIADLVTTYGPETPANRWFWSFNGLTPEETAVAVQSAMNHYLRAGLISVD